MSVVPVANPGACIKGATTHPFIIHRLPIEKVRKTWYNKQRK